MLNDDNINQNTISFIQKYKTYFNKENVLDVVQDIQNEKLSDLFISKDYKELVSIDKNYIGNIDTIGNGIYDKFHLSQINSIEVPSILNNAYDHKIPTHFIDFSSYSVVNNQIQNFLNIIINISNFAIPIFFLLLFISSIRSFNQMNSLTQPSNSLNMINRNPMNPINPMNPMKSLNGNDNFVTPNVSLSSWAGSPEVLEECREVVSYLDNKDLFKETGAEMPKGILLEGPPGTGKTLIAKGIATETNSTFISISGSEFVELFVGMGAAKVRDLFKNARQNAPCIIFIDEIDAIGKQRGNGALLASNDEREQTLNQILFEMDGFKNNDGLLILAATNRKDILDKALLRPGRFDRIIKVPLPDKYSRQKILEYYCSLKKMEPNIDISSLAEITDGFSGAELKNLINEAAILTARQKKIIIGEKELFNAFEKLIVGIIRNNNDASINTKRRIAIHESGHAILALHYPEYFELQKVSIQATYGGAGGYTLFTENPEIKEGGLYTRDILKKRLIITLGGKAAEYIYYGQDYVSLGAIQDLKQANQLAQKMIGNFGMGEKLEVFFNENINDDNTFYGNNKYSEYTKINMDKESLNLIVEAYNESKQILNEKRDLLMNMTDLLLNQTVLNKKDIP
jgi:ATP-dependent metalloprotease FtsH